MRALLCALLVIWTAPVLLAQDPANANANKADENAPKEAPLWSMGEKESSKLHKRLYDYIYPGRRQRIDTLAKLAKFASEKVDGHSVLEDVATWTRLAMWSRTFGSTKKLGRPGKINSVKVQNHGFPGIGTVEYDMYLPVNYNPRKTLSPVIFCLPNRKDWPDGRKYIEEVWVSRSEGVANDYIVVVPHRHTKGERWSSPKTMAGAMITLRHVMGTFEIDPKGKQLGGPASDPTRVFIDGEDVAGQTAARFAELFAGAVLRHSNGKTVGRIDLSRAGGLSGLPAYCVTLAKDGSAKKRQVQFAQKLRASNGKTLIVADDKGLGDAKAMHQWMENITDPKDGVRNLQPRKIEYTIHDPSFQRHYWINVLEYDSTIKPAANFFGEADRAKNEIRIDVTGVTLFEVFVNDAIVDLNKPLKVLVVDEGQELVVHDGPLQRELNQMLAEMLESNQPWRMYPRRLTVNVPELRKEAAKAAAAKKKPDEEKKKDGTGADATMD